MSVPMRYSQTVLFGIAVLLGASGCSKDLVKQQRVTSRKALAGRVKTLEIRNHNGRIELIGEAAVDPKIEVTATQWAKARTKEKAQQALKRIQIKLHRVKDLATLLVKHPKSTSAVKYGVDLRVAVPFGVGVDADTEHGDIRSMGLTGALNLRTGKGSLVIRAARSTLKAETVDGNILVSGAVPSFNVVSKKGNVTLHVRNLTELDEASLVRAEAGNIKLSLNRDMNARLSVQAKGAIVSPWSGLVKKGSTLSGKLGAGGKLITVVAPRGKVTLLSRMYMRSYQDYIHLPMRKRRPRPSPVDPSKLRPRPQP